MEETLQIIDADGHIFEGPYADEIASYMPKGNRAKDVFPALDHFHRYFLRADGRHERGATTTIGPAEWDDFLDKTGIEWTVVYPTTGLAVGRIVARDWAIAACRAYNNWLHDRFVNASPRIQGMALIPVQDPQAAAAELRRAVTELGMVGGMLPSNGEGLQAHLGAGFYWPIYEEAEQLGCALAIHGGCHHRLGMDSFGTFYPVLALGHPFSIMIQAAGLLFHGVFERFPGLRVAFLEGGATWVAFFMDRIDRSFESHIQLDIDGEPVPGPRPGETPSDYLRRHIQEGRIFVGFDCDDNGLGLAVERAGREPFLFASDFPHESFNAATCRHEIDELLSRDDLSDADKAACVGGNALRLYGAQA